MTKNLTSRTATILVAVILSGCASRPERTQVAEEQPIVKSAIAGMVAVPRERRSEGIQLNVAGDATATEALAARLTQVGYRVAKAAEPARFRLGVAPIYAGPDRDRPLVGTAEKNRTFGLGDVFDFTNTYLPSGPEAAVTFLGQAPARTVLTLVNVALRATGVRESMDQAYFGYTRQPKPVDALVMRMTLVDGDRIQDAEILTQSYANEVPLELMVDDSVKTMVWLLE